jgi:uncharacterized protein YkwD
MRDKQLKGWMVLLGTAVLTLILFSTSHRALSAPLARGSDASGPVYLPIVAKQLVPTATPIPPDDLAVEQYIATQINQRRRAAGLPPLALDAALTQAARAHSHDMSGMDSPSHTGSDGSSPEERVEAAGYEGTYVGEIIAWGHRGSADVIEWWMNSPPHRAMILSTWATEYGVGYVRDEESLYINFWTVDFGRSSSQGAAARAPLYACMYTAQGPEGGSRLAVYRSEPCP